MEQKVNRKSNFIKRKSYFFKRKPYFCTRKHYDIIRKYYDIKQVRLILSTFYIRRKNKKVDSIETGRIVIAGLRP